jgi:hypothetical protein
MKCSCLKHCAWLVCIALGVFGCQSSDEPIVAGDAAARAGAPTPAARPEPKANGPLSAKTESKNAPAVIAQFSPPFPERDTLFEPPKRAQGTVRRNEALGESVELKGFINVNEPRVVLSIDGVISSVPVGGEKYGVQVISIQPPTVVLQRGRDRWPATLE